MSPMLSAFVFGISTLGVLRTKTSGCGVQCAGVAWKSFGHSGHSLKWTWQDLPLLGHNLINWHLEIFLVKFPWSLGHFVDD